RMDVRRQGQRVQADLTREDSPPRGLLGAAFAVPLWPCRDERRGRDDVARLKVDPGVFVPPVRDLGPPLQRPADAIELAVPAVLEREQDRDPSALLAEDALGDLAAQLRACSVAAGDLIHRCV